MTWPLNCDPRETLLVRWHYNRSIEKHCIHSMIKWLVRSHFIKGWVTLKQNYLNFADYHSINRSVQKNGTFICEILMEHDIYLRNTQKQLKIKSYGGIKSSLEVHLLYNGVFFETPRIIILQVRDFASLCINKGGAVFITTFNVLSTFCSVFVYISYTVKMPFIYWLHSEVGSSPVFTLSKYGDIFWEKVVILNVNTF